MQRGEGEGFFAAPSLKHIDPSLHAFDICSHPIFPHAHLKEVEYWKKESIVNERRYTDDSNQNRWNAHLCYETTYFD